VVQLLVRGSKCALRCGFCRVLIGALGWSVGNAWFRCTSSHCNPSCRAPEADSQALVLRCIAGSWPEMI
jgi:hypothetical protein